MADKRPPAESPDGEPRTGTGSGADIRLAAMNLLARREHSVQELRSKLRRRFSDEVALDEQLERLAAERLQSDARFAESYARQRAEKGYGPVRLRAELRERGIADADIDAALDALDIDWGALASRVLEGKFRLDTPADLRERARRARFMQYRGFASDHYRQSIED